jgi:hypothetical protein
MILAVVIPAVVLQMSCVAALLAIAAIALALSRSRRATAVVYGATLTICVAALFGSLRWLVGEMANFPANSSDVILPIGLPWLGAHFRLRWRLFSWSSSIWAAPQPASMASATATTTRRRTACFPSSPPSSPA